MTTTTETVTAPSIASLVEGTLQEAGYGSYNRYATPVVDALVAREQGLSEQLISYAESEGANVDEVKALLGNIGMAITPEPEPEPEPEDDDDDTFESRIEKAIAGITSRLDAMATFARRHGFTG